VSVALLCRLAGTTRQNYYQQRSVRQRVVSDERLVLELVQRERALQPQLGARKLLHMLDPELIAAGVSMGRDRFIALLSREDLLIARQKRSVRTTDSRHHLRLYPNLAASLVLTAPHQLLVADLTYIRTLEGFMYLCLVTDAFSRMIVGHDCSDSLEMEGALRALSQALRQLPAGAAAMHHSDRGIQYCCQAYTQKLRAAGVTISMTEANHCYENSLAERLNGTLKREYGLGETFASKRLVGPAVRQAVTLYNQCRPHASLGYATPMQVHAGAGSGTYWRAGSRGLLTACS
jgi:transposase InsO family protein